MEKYLKRLAGYLGVMSPFVLGHSALAQLDPGQDVQLPQGEPITLGLLKEWLTNIVNFVITAGFLIAVGFIIYSGILYVTAGEDPKKVEKAKKTFKNAFIGALVILGINVIIGTIGAIVGGGFFDIGFF